MNEHYLSRKKESMTSHCMLLVLFSFSLDDGVFFVMFFLHNRQDVMT